MARAKHSEFKVSGSPINCPQNASPLQGNMDAKGEYTPLLVEHEIVNMPSATALATLRTEAKNRPLAAKAIAVLADPVFTNDDPRIKKSTRGTIPLLSLSEFSYPSFVTFRIK
jgi:hypothetical protein